MTGPVDVIEGWADAWRRRDAEALAALFAEDATYCAAVTGELYRVRRQLRLAVRMWPEVSISELVADVVEQGPQMAVVNASYRFVGTDRDAVAHAYRARATFVLRRPGEGAPWLISRFHESYADGSDPPLSPSTPRS